MMGTLYAQSGPPGASSSTHAAYSLPIDQSASSSCPPESRAGPSSPSVDTGPEWKRGPFTEKLLSLLCYTKQSWQYQPERSREIIRSSIKSFIENNSEQVMLSVELDERGMPSLIGATPNYLSALKAENFSTDPDLIIHRLLTGHESIFCTSARTAQINFILPAAYFNPSGCHRLIYEKSNQFMYQGELRSGQFWLGLFYDHQDRIAACCGYTDLHDSLLPVTKAYLVTDSCRHCSKLPPLPPGIQVPAFRSPDPYYLDTKEKLGIEQIRHAPTSSRCSCPPLHCICATPDREPVTPVDLSGPTEFFSPPLS